MHIVEMRVKGGSAYLCLPRELHVAYGIEGARAHDAQSASLMAVSLSERFKASLLVCFSMTIILHGFLV